MPCPSLAPAVVLLDHERRLDWTTPEASAWLQAAELRPEDLAEQVVEARSTVLTVDDEPRAVAYARRVDAGLVVVLSAPTPAVAIPAIARRHGLTPRETEVLRLLVGGRTDAEIAAELVITVPTAREHSGRVLRKVGAGRRSQLGPRLFPALYAGAIASQGS